MPISASAPISSEVAIGRRTNVSETFMAPPPGSWCQRRAGDRRPGVHTLGVDAGARLQPVLAIDHDLLAGVETAARDRDIGTDGGGLDGALLDRAVGLDHPGIETLRRALQRHGWNC